MNKRVLSLGVSAQLTGAVRQACTHFEAPQMDLNMNFKASDVFLQNVCNGGHKMEKRIRRRIQLLVAFHIVIIVCNHRPIDSLLLLQKKSFREGFDDYIVDYQLP